MSNVYKHDCDACIFLGNHSSGKKIIDIYWCRSNEPSLTSIIGRYGNEGGEYYSSHPPIAFVGREEIIKKAIAANTWYATALKLAEAQGFYDPKTMNAKDSK